MAAPGPAPTGRSAPAPTRTAGLEPTRSPGALNEAVKKSLSLHLPRRPQHPNTSTPQGLPFCGRTAPARRQTLPAGAAPGHRTARPPPHMPGHWTQQSLAVAPALPPGTEHALSLGGEQVHPRAQHCCWRPADPAPVWLGWGQLAQGRGTLAAGPSGGPPALLWPALAAAGLNPAPGLRLRETHGGDAGGMCVTARRGPVPPALCSPGLRRWASAPRRALGCTLGNLDLETEPPGQSPLAPPLRCLRVEHGSLGE